MGHIPHSSDSGPRSGLLCQVLRDPSVLVIAALCLVLLPMTEVRAVKSEYEVKAIFLERFSRFVTWPEDSRLNKPGSRFVLCLIGSNPFGTRLHALYGPQPIKERRVRLLFFHTVPTEKPLSSCHLLFISASEHRRLTNILQHVRYRPILTVGSTDGYAEQGVHINMYVVENKIRFEINESAVRRSGLKMSYHLLKTAKIVSPIEP